MPNALQPGFFLRPPPAEGRTPCTLLHVGVICERKQQMKMLALARSLCRKKLDFKLHFIGIAAPDSDYAKAFLSEIQDAEREGYARYLGNKPTAELMGCFDGASALVHTPQSEPFGLVVAESLARNLKFFGFSVGGVSDIVEGAEDASLVPGEDWTGLECAIEAWLRAGHPPPRPAAALMRQRYHPEIIARRHVEIYRDVLGRTRQDPKITEALKNGQSVPTLPLRMHSC